MRAHTLRFRPIYGDTDMMGIVYYANYLRYFEAGRNELMRSLGITYAEFEGLGLGLPVVRVEVEYRSPARYDEELELLTILEQARHASLKIAYKLTRGGTVLVEGHTVHACTDRDGRPTRLPAAVKARLLAPPGDPG